MSSGSESEGEFYDAQDAPPDATHTAHSAHHHKRGSLSKHTSGEKSQPAESRIGADPDAVISLLAQSIDDDHASVKNVVQGRQKFRELRKHMQTEDEDATPTTNSTPDSQTSSVEGLYAIVPKAKHPFKIIEHDAMSLQSMTSLGRIGRILSGAGESSGNVLTPAGVSREPSTLSDEQMPPPPPPPPPQPGLAMQEPDVIASTKSNSLKHSRPADGGAPAAAPPSAGASHRAHAHTEPVPPPRRKKRGKMYSSQSLCGSDGDNVSVSTTDDSYRFDARATHTALAAHGLEKGPLQRLIVEPALTEMLFPHQALPSPASTIESLTRDFQHSLDHAKLPAAAPGANTPNTGGRAKSCATSPADRKASAERLNRSGSSSRSSTTVSVRSHHSTNALSSNQYSLDIKSAIKGHYVVKPQDEDTLRSSGPLLPGSGRTQSEDRAPGAVGHSSLGSAHRWREEGGAAGGGGRGRERRRSAGDEEALARRVERELRQLNMKLRTRTDSGKQLSDMEILEQVTVLNLDTGERVPLSVAEHKLPQCVNPLSLHIMRLTSEYISSRSNDDDNTRETDEESECVGLGADGNTDSAGSGSKRGSTPTGEQPPTGIRRKTDKLKRFLGSTVKKTMDAAKSLAQEVSHARHKEDVGEIADDVRGETNIKLKASNSHKGPYDFDGCVRHVQEMSGQHAGAVWCMKFSVCGRLLATAGQDKLLRVWVLRDAAHFFQDMRTEYNAAQKSSPTPSQESLASLTAPPHSPEEKPPPGPMAPFCPKPFCTYIGHTSDLLDVAWSKNYFVLSSSMDKTVRLWHISRGECLCCFQHIDFVTAIAFHPRDDRYFLSGSLDGKLRLWNIPDKKVAVWNEVDGQTKLITAANFCQNGKFAVVGTYDGRCIFYTTDQLKYHTQIDVRSTRGKNSTGRKISGIEPMPNDDKILVTSNDSRIRLYDLRDLNLSCKYKGYVNVSSQIKASFSHDGKYIVSGSENQCIYIWKTHHDYSKFSSVRRDRNDFWEGIKAHSAVVTCAVFAPNPEHVIRGIAEREDESASRGRSAGAGAGAGAAGAAAGRSHCAGHVLLSADFNGCIKVFVNKSKPKHSSLPASALA